MENTLSKQESKSHYVRCTCSCQILEVECYDYSYVDKKTGQCIPDDGFNFTIWARGRQGKVIYGLRERLRWCWNILKTGMPWADDIIATNQDARELAEFILQNIPKEKINEETKS